MSPALANFLFEAANFSILTALLGRVLFKPVRAALDDERAAHRAADAHSEELRKQAEAIASDAREATRKGRESLENERAELLTRARAEAAALLEQARAEDAGRRDELHAELASERAAAIEVLRRELGVLAADAVRRLLVAVGGPELDHALARAACAQLHALPAACRERALIEGARPLDAETHEQLAAALPAGFDYRELADLGVGLRITTRAGQVDLSAASFANQAQRALEARLEARDG